MTVRILPLHHRYRCLVWNLVWVGKWREGQWVNETGWGPVGTRVFLRAMGGRSCEPTESSSLLWGGPKGPRTRGKGELCGRANVPEREGTSLPGAPTWRHPGGDGRGRHLALALGGHGGHLDGVGGERSEACDAVLQGHVGQVVCHAGVGSVILLPGDPVPWGDPVVA